MDCKHASRMISQSLDHRLSLVQRISLWLHLFICDACKEFSRQVALLRTMMARLGRHIENDPELTLPEQARQRISTVLAERADGAHD